MVKQMQDSSSDTRKSLLCVQQGFEKYGSDRCFASSVAALKKTNDYNVSVLIPAYGPIMTLLGQISKHDVQTRHLWILRRPTFLRSITVDLFKSIAAVWRAGTDLKRYDFVYVNTIVVFDFLIAMVFVRGKAIVHVHEIPTGFVLFCFRAILMAARADVIFNSNATKAAFALPDSQRQSVVYNGFDPPEPTNRRVTADNIPLKILCIGRLNEWKGQDILVQAISSLPKSMRRLIQVRIVGGVFPGKEGYRDRIMSLIGSHGLADCIELIDFVDDPAEHYRWADIVVVPSTLPEPFGRVAIEGMAYGCAIIASNLGGLSEIIIHGETGILIQAQDPIALRDALSKMIEGTDSVLTLGMSARARFNAFFTQDAIDTNFITTMRTYMAAT